MMPMLQSRNGRHAMTVLPNLQQQLEAAQAIIAKQAELLAAANKPKAITLKVSGKGALSIYGLGRFPVTLYRSQWERLLDHAPTIGTFIATNSALLTVKS
jgi:hypothetical protein